MGIIGDVRLVRAQHCQPCVSSDTYTRYPSVLSSFSYTADLRHSFIKELQGIGALY
jgi:hypothetical protein